ncbi:leucine-rich repeat domain-containing protein [Wolbachia endosymbiont (group B) of Philonthus cognatus]|uniref:hypothetical protein n=1 Tax=Wolbachia endosymbiont (group B) of Philonthus cognatus TaxID=2954047 RepID=UPI00221EF0DF|nr:hypothetical protein [Wolbachia endosymbiont (group B) of Philonthus cognatus]
MNFNKHVNDNKLLLVKKRVDIKKLLSFLQENKNITELSINHCGIGKEGAEALANSENLKNFTTLNLRGNNIGKEGAEALANSENLKNLTTLNLIGNNIGKEGAEALANSENLKNLTTLDLGWNNIDLQGAKALLKSDNFPNLKLLSFHSGNKFYSGNKIDLLQQIENDQSRRSKAIITGSVCGVIAALTVGIGCGVIGIELSILAIAGIAVAAALVIGVIAGCITYSVSKPSDKLDKPDLEVANQQVNGVS